MKYTNLLKAINRISKKDLITLADHLHLDIDEMKKEDIRKTVHSYLSGFNVNERSSINYVEKLRITELFRQLSKLKKKKKKIDQKIEIIQTSIDNISN